MQRATLPTDREVLSPVYREPSLRGRYIQEDDELILCSPYMTDHVIVEKYLYDEANGTDIPIGAAAINLFGDSRKMYLVRKGGGEDPRSLMYCPDCKNIFTDDYDIICDSDHEAEFRDRFSIKGNKPDGTVNHRKGDIHIKHEYEKNGNLYLIEFGPIHTSTGACPECIKVSPGFLRQAAKLFITNPEKLSRTPYPEIIGMSAIQRYAQEQTL